MRRRPATSRIAVSARVARLGPEAADRQLLRVIDDGFARAAAVAGPWLVCAPGCDDCCHGPFPVTVLDADRLRRGLAELERSDPARTRAIGERAREAVRQLSDGFPGEIETGRLRPEPEALDRFFERHARLACPALDPASGRCELYDWRPVACRTYGPPLRFAGIDAAHCPLCFRGAGEQEIERCRTEPDAGGLEQAMLATTGVPPGEEWETLIAFALARSPGDR